MDYTEIIAKANPSQSHWELNQLLNNIPREKIHNVLEIGIHRGGSLRVWKNVFYPDILVGIDGQILPEARIDGVAYIEGFSQDPKTFALTTAICDHFDFIFLDGSHLYPDVKKDFEMYSPLLNPGGMVGFHDVVIKDNDLAEVYKLWDELKVNHKTITIWDGTPTGTGEGLLWI